MAEELHPDLYPGEGLLEEEQIIEERTGPVRKALDARSLQEPIQVLPFVPPLCVTRETSIAAEDTNRTSSTRSYCPWSRSPSCNGE